MKYKVLLFKIVSPGFEINYGLSEKEVINNLEKIIKYSEPNKDIETVFIWPEGVLSGYYFNELKEFKDIIKKIFQKTRNYFWSQYFRFYIRKNL